MCRPANQPRCKLSEGHKRSGALRGQPSFERLPWCPLLPAWPRAGPATRRQSTFGVSLVGPPFSQATTFPRRATLRLNSRAPPLFLDFLEEVTSTHGYLPNPAAPLPTTNSLISRGYEVSARSPTPSKADRASLAGPA